jgi:hypothetical protein
MAWTPPGSFHGMIAVNSWVAPRHQEEAKMDATTVAVDLAKDVFEVAVANRAGRITERKRLTRRQFERFIDTIPRGTAVIMEGCGTAPALRSIERDESSKVRRVLAARPEVIDDRPSAFDVALRDTHAHVHITLERQVRHRRWNIASLQETLLGTRPPVPSPSKSRPAYRPSSFCPAGLTGVAPDGRRTILSDRW